VLTLTTSGGEALASARRARAAGIARAIREDLDDAEREIIRRTVDAYPTLKEAARVLGIGLRTLHTKLQRYQLRRATAPPTADPAARR